MGSSCTHARKSTQNHCHADLKSCTCPPILFDNLLPASCVPTPQPSSVEAPGTLPHTTLQNSLQERTPKGRRQRVNGSGLLPSCGPAPVCPNHCSPLELRPERSKKKFSNFVGCKIKFPSLSEVILIKVINVLKHSTVYKLNSLKASLPPRKERKYYRKTPSRKRGEYIFKMRSK